MSKNEWLKRAEKRKAEKEALMAALAQPMPSVRERAAQIKKTVAEIKKAVPDATVIVNCCTRDNIQVQDPVMAEHAIKEDKVNPAWLKFKGKFQEADKVNKQGRMYPSKVLEESIKKIAAEGKTEIPGQDDPLHERWHPPTEDECGWIPIRPTADKVELNQKSVQEVSAAANEFHDLSAVKGSNSRFKEYERLRLMEDAVAVYQVGRSEPRDIKLMDISVVASGGYPMGPQGCIGAQGPQGPQGVPGDDQAALEAGDLGEVDDLAYFKNKLFNALKMPKQVSKELASKDIKFARQYERETGESLCEWKELNSKELIAAAKLQKIEELKMQVMAQNPMIMGVPAPEANSVCVGPQGCQGFTVGSYQPATPIRFHPDQIVHMEIGEDRRVFSVNVDVKPEKAEAFIEKLKAEFKKRAREDKRWKNIEAQAAESETWFAANGPNRGQVPSIIDVFADIAAETYMQVSAKVDKMCNEVFLDTPCFTINTPTPEGVTGANVMTITAPPADMMANSMIGDGIVVAGPLNSHGDYNINIGGC